MGKPYSDRTQAETLDPIVINPKTVNNYREAVTLNKDELQQGDNIILDDGVIEKIQGTTKGNSDTVASPVTGLHRSYGPSTEKVCLRLANGSLKRTPAAFGTTVLSGLSTTKITPFVNIRGKAYGINETDGIIKFDPRSNIGVKTGIVNPFLRKKIAFFETDEPWAVVGGTCAADTGLFRPEEFSGNSSQSWKITAGASSSSSIKWTFGVGELLDLTTFSNNKASTVQDYIVFHTYHHIRNNIESLTVTFDCDTGVSEMFTITLYPRDLSEGDFQYTEWKIKKSAFTGTASADWSHVNKITLIVTANSSGSAIVNFDYMYLKIAPISASIAKKKIFDAESSETVSGDATVSYDQAHEGTRSLVVAGTAGGAARITTVDITSIDLTEWTENIPGENPHGSSLASPTTDEIVFWIRTNDTTAINNTDPLILTMGADSSNY